MLGFTYNKHPNIAWKYKLIRRDTVTNAAIHDSQALDEVLLAKTAGCDVWADAVYRFQAIEAKLKRRKLRSRVQYKGYRIPF
ncbi:hypothetical protein PJI16_10730 [Nitrospira sp. MA-1]|nr:hypothetical protein [Nitrospira sp. MA-1]